MDKLELNWKRLTIFGFILFLISVFTLNISAFCDETYYLENVTIFQTYFFGDDFFRLLKGPAGPTFAWVHFLFEPFTHLDIFRSRLVNVLLFVVMIILFRKLFMQTVSEHFNQGWLNILIVPTTFVIAGFAITQVPTLIFLLLSIYLMYRLLNEELSLAQNIIYNLLFAACFALAILGRQPYLVLGLSMGIYALQQSSFNILTAAGKFYGLGLTLLPLMYVFSIWNGIQPPSTLFVQEGLRVDHLLYAFGYAGIYILIITPRFFVPVQNRKQLFGIIGGFAFLYIANLFVGFATKTPLKNIVNRILGDTLLYHWSIFASTLLIAFALYFAFTILFRIYENRNSNWFIFLGISTMLIFATCIKITHQFSALYPYQAIPFLLLMAAKYDTINKYKLIVSGLLIILGCFNYFFYA